jgi:Carboxypeptidase regulatory-like domain
MRWFSAIFLLAITVSTCQAQELAEKCAPTYQNHNMVDYGPLVFRKVSGRAIDPSSEEMPGACLGLFTDDGQRLVTVARTDQSGNFALTAIPPGRYRLVADVRGFCVANIRLRIVRWPRVAHRELVLHMKPGAIDACSYGGYK